MRHGTPLLEKLVSFERARISIASVRLELDPPRPAQARAAGERLVVRNGLSEVVDVVIGEAVYVAAAIAYVAEADDRHEGLMRLVVESMSGGAPDEHFTALVDPARATFRMRTVSSVAESAAGAAPFIARRAAQLAREAVEPTAESVARRQWREHARICEYFEALAGEARSPRRNVDAAAIAAKVSHFIGERDAKLRDLEVRYRLRVSMAPAALVAVTAPAASVRLRLRRRKGERELVLRLPAGARWLDSAACDGCAGVAGKVLLCDERLHVLCETCAPSAEGRPSCVACRRKGGKNG